MRKRSNLGKILCMNYAVVQTGGKQYKVGKGTILEVDNLNKDSQELISFDKVLLYVNEGKVNIGLPFINNVKVLAKVEGNFKSKKITVAKFRAKSRYRRLAGFRRTYTKVVVEDIKEEKPSAAEDKKKKV